MLCEDINRTALLIEPVPWFFKQLKENYKNIPNPNRIFYENVVVNTYNGECKFHCMSPEQKYTYNYQTDADWGREISSCNEQIIKQHQELFLQSGKFNYQTLRLPCVTTESLLKKYNLDNIEYLKIDAEGMDAILLLNWPFNICKPKYIKFETTHLDGEVNKSSFYTQLNSFLSKNNYKFLKSVDRDVIFIYKI